MTGLPTPLPSAEPLPLDEQRRRALVEVVGRWAALHPGPGGEGAAEGDPPDILQAEVLVSGRPGLLDVLATVGGRVAHAVLGLHRVGDQPRFLAAGDRAVLGLLDDDDGLGVVVDALGDAGTVVALVAAVTGRAAPADGVTVVADRPDGIALALPGHALTVFGWPEEGPHPGLELLAALDDHGFNHLPAPLALWRRGGRDLGVVQELAPGAAAGGALAEASLRDLLASGGRPEEAGADFGPEAYAIGIMAARMHLALDRAYGRRGVEVSGWMDQVERTIRAGRPDLLHDGAAADALEALRRTDLRATVLARTHGDFTLARTARTDSGWLVADVLPGGRPPGEAAPVARSPLCDVADMLWSLHAVAAAAGRAGGAAGDADERAGAWEARNRRAVLAGYLSTPGIGGLVPTDRQVVRDLLAVLEVERAARPGADGGDAVPQ